MTWPSALASISHPVVRHRLAVALRFVDAFTGAAIAVPLSVRAEVLPVVPGMPRIPWHAVRAGDGTYRLLTTGTTVQPVGAIDVIVTALDDEYLDAEPAPVMLPRPLAGPLPTRADFIVTRTLWPTRRLALPAGETSVVGNVRTAAGVAAVGYRVTLGELPIAAAPYAYTDAAGDFLVPLPSVRTLSPPPGSAMRTSAPLGIEIRSPPAFAALVVPATPVFPWPAPIGRSSTLFVTIP
jgi:hypothetical protein